MNHSTEDFIAEARAARHRLNGASALRIASALSRYDAASAAVAHAAKRLDVATVAFEVPPCRGGFELPKPGDFDDERRFADNFEAMIEAYCAAAGRAVEAAVRAADLRTRPSDADLVRLARERAAA